MGHRRKVFHVYWNSDFWNTRFLKPSDFSNQKSFPLEVREIGIPVTVYIFLDWINNLFDIGGERLAYRQARLSGHWNDARE